MENSAKYLKRNDALLLLAKQLGQKQAFTNEELLKRLNERIIAWEGGKYCHMGVNKAGVDCTKLVAMIFIELGIFSGIDDVFYSSDWFLHTSEEIAINELARHCEKYLTNEYKHFVLDYDEKILLPGDVIFFAMLPNKPCHHAAIYCENNKIFHAINNLGVCFAAWCSAFWGNRARKIIRIVK